MSKKIVSIIFVFFFLQHCEYKPIYSNLNNLDFNLNVVEVNGDNEMNNLFISNIKKYSNLSSNKVFNLKVKTKYKKTDFIKNKKGEVTTFLITNEISFDVNSKEKSKNYTFSEQLKTKNNNDKFEFKKYEKTIKNNFINSKINELILNLSSMK